MVSTAWGPKKPPCVLYLKPLILLSLYFGEICLVESFLFPALHSSRYVELGLFEGKIRSLKQFLHNIQRKSFPLKLSEQDATGQRPVEKEFYLISKSFLPPLSKLLSRPVSRLQTPEGSR